MKPEFRFPRSTVFLMSLILLGVMIAMRKASDIVAAYATGFVVPPVWPSVLLNIGLMILGSLVAGAVVLSVLHALRRTGVQRLNELQSWHGRA